MAFARAVWAGSGGMEQVNESDSVYGERWRPPEGSWGEQRAGVGGEDVKRWHELTPGPAYGLSLSSCLLASRA
jgi:hypothetical protein